MAENGSMTRSEGQNVEEHLHRVWPFRRGDEGTDEGIAFPAKRPGPRVELRKDVTEPLRLEGKREGKVEVTKETKAEGDPAK